MYIDLSNIYNSSKFTNTSDMFLTIPITMVAKLYATADGADTVIPINNTSNIKLSNLLSLKSNFCNLIHKADLTLNGKIIEQQQDFLNKFVEFKMLSEMNETDLSQYGYSLGMSKLDNPKSVRYIKTSNNANYRCNGNGITNNVFYYPYTNTKTNIDVFGEYGKNSYSKNNALKNRLNRYRDFVNNKGDSWDGLYELQNKQSLNEETNPYVEFVNNNIVYNDVCVVRLSDLFDSLNQMGLVKKLDGVLRLYLNTGSCVVDVSKSGELNPGTVNMVYSFNGLNSNFSYTLPYTVNYLNNDLPVTCTSIISGLFVSKSVNSSNLNSNNKNLTIEGGLGTNNIQSVRVYYSLIELNYLANEQYINKFRQKEVVYRTIQNINESNISSGSNFSKLLYSGITNAVGLLMLPYISKSDNLFNPLKINLFSSPFDTNFSHPLSITNI